MRHSNNRLRGKSDADSVFWVIEGRELCELMSPAELDIALRQEKVYSDWLIAQWERILFEFEVEECYELAAVMVKYLNPRHV